MDGRRYIKAHTYRRVKSVSWSGISCVDCWAASAGQAGEEGGTWEERQDGPGRDAVARSLPYATGRSLAFSFYIVRIVVWAK